MSKVTPEVTKNVSTLRPEKEKELKVAVMQSKARATLATTKAPEHTTRNKLTSSTARAPKHMTRNRLTSIGLSEIRRMFIAVLIT